MINVLVIIFIGIFIIEVIVIIIGNVFINFVFWIWIVYLKWICFLLISFVVVDLFVGVMELIVFIIDKFEKMILCGRKEDRIISFFVVF